jgi:hypothetical protein
MNKGAGALVSGCFSPSHLLKAFGTAGLLLAPIVAVGGLVAFFHGEWNALVDQFNGHDKYTVAITRANQPPVVQPTLGTSAWASSIPGEDATGFGEVSPPDINSLGGNDPTGYVSSITWTNWGASEATGQGKAIYFTNPNAPVSGQPVVNVTVVAFDLGTCGSGPAYQAYEYYFPEYGESFSSTNYEDTCTGLQNAPQKPSDAKYAAGLLWQQGAADNAAVQSGDWLQAAADLTSGISTDGGDTSGYSTAANELTDLASIPDTNDTATQAAQQQADITALDAFFGTPNLYG